MTGTWDPILPPHHPPRSSPLPFCPLPLLLPASLPLSLSLFLSSLSRTRLTLADAVRWQSRISLVVLFPIAASVRCRVLPYLRPPPSPLPFFLRSLSTRGIPIYLPTLEHSPYTLSLSLALPFSKHYFSSATNAKLKRISPILSVNMPVQLPRVARSFSSASAPASLATVLAHLLHVSPAVVYSTIFAILLTIIRIRRSANGYGGGGVVRLQLGRRRRVVLLFRDRLLVNSGTVAPARISRLRLLRRALARENMYLYRGGLRDKAEEEV